MAKTKKRSDGRYQKLITIGRKPDGSLARIAVYGRTLKELETKVANIQVEIEEGIFLSGSDITFGKIAETWINYFKTDIGEKMKLRYKGVLNGHLSPLNDIRVKDLKPLHLQMIINKMHEDGYAQKSMQIVKQAASQVLDLALQNQMVYRNVFEKTKIPHVDAVEREPLTEEQKSLILKTWKGHRMGVPALVLLYCGLRRGELLALLWSDIDLKANTLRVSKAADMPRNETKIKKPKTKAGNRVIPIPDILSPVLEDARRKAESLYVCPSVKNGGVMSAQAYREAWNSYMHYLNIQAGGRDASRSNPKVIAMDPFTAQQLRHTYATMLYDADVDVKTAQKLLGHKDLTVTMKIYTHLSAKKETIGIDRLNNHLSEEFGQKTLMNA